MSEGVWVKVWPENYDPNKPGLEGLGGWAEITSLGNGTTDSKPKRYDYTADGVEFWAFEWTDDGSLTTQAGGLVDALVCGAGCASSSNPTNVKNGGKAAEYTKSVSHYHYRWSCCQ